MENLSEIYELKKQVIQARLKEFRELPEDKYLDELLFCTLTPQSQAKKCWDAVIELNKIKNKNKHNVADVLKSRTRFHNNKARYILYNIESWKKIQEQLSNPDIIELRNWLAENVQGFGLKESGHFLRNIGKSNNRIAILDRHILRNLKNFNVIESDEIRNKKHYAEMEDKFIEFSNKIGIPVDELDLLFWSNENGDIFK